MRTWAHTVKRDIFALYLATRDPRVPATAKILAAVVVGYALSPIDLIPDLIPVLGYLDDLVLLPVGVVLVVQLIPQPLMDELRRQEADGVSLEKPSDVAVIAIVAIWSAACVGLLFVLVRAGLM